MSALVMTLAAPCVVMAALGGGALAGASAPSGPVEIDMFVPLTGPSGTIGPTDDIPGFKAAQYVINKDGGILGRKLNLIETNLGADPTDSITAAHQMLAQYPNLAGVVGMTSTTALVSAQVFNDAKMVTITQSGTTQLDHVHFKYVFRDYPSDSSENSALTAAALTRNYKRVALMFGENSGSQSNAIPTAALLRAHGAHIVADEALPLDQTSYATVIAKVLSSHPDLIIYETDATTAATLFPELESAMKGAKRIPVLGTAYVGTPSWTKEVAKAVGGYTGLAKIMQFLTAPTNPPGSAYPEFVSALKHVENQPKQYENAYDSDNFDSVIIEALAMDMAGSTKPTVYVRDIEKIINTRRGKGVTSYAQGLADIKHHKPFHYVTTIGPLLFNKYHSVASVWDISTIRPSGKIVVLKQLSERAIARYS